MADEAKARGNSAFSIGNFTQAVTHFTDAINLSPNNHILYSNRSAAHASLSNFTQALSDAQKTVDLKPDWSKGYSRLGAAYTGLKNYSEAISSYQKGLEIDSENEALKSALANAKLGLEKKQKDLINAFNSTESTQQLLETYEEMETCFEDEMLGIECFTLLDTLIQQNRRQDAKIILNKASKILLGNEKCSSGNPCSLDDNFNFLFAKVSNLLGSACLESKEYDNSLQHLNLANMILTTKFENDEASVCEGKCVLRALAFNESLYHRVTTFMGKFVESALHAKKCLGVKEKFMEEGCHDLALANMDVFIAYGLAMMCNEALPYGWKALEIHAKNLGSDHLEVAKIRSKLAFMYRELGEQEKAREQDELAKNFLATRESPNDMIDAGRFEEAIAVLKGNVLRDDVQEEVRAMDFVSMGNAFYKMGKYSDAKKHFQSALDILEKFPGIFNQGLVMMAFLEISEMYMKMNDTEAALSLLKKVMAFPDLAPNLLPRAASIYLLLVSESDKAKEEIPYMLDLVEKLKKLISGPEHCDLGYGCECFGVKYWNSGQQELVMKFMEDAKSILDAAIGPNHIDSLKTGHTLSDVYGRMGRYARALENEKQVVKGLKGLAPSELGFIHEVNKLLNEMKKWVADSSTTASSQSKDRGPPVKISESDISGDGKGT